MIAHDPKKCVNLIYDMEDKMKLLYFKFSLNFNCDGKMAVKQVPEANNCSGTFHEMVVLIILLYGNHLILLYRN